MLRFSVLLLLPALLPSQTVPRTWADADVRELDLPLANPAYTPVHPSEQDYYRMPARTVYRSYPVYHPDREPPGYQEYLRKQEPQPAVDLAGVKTAADWIKAGEVMFNAPASFGPVFFSADDLRNPAFYKETGMPVARDGTVPFARWVIREKGKVEMGSMGCATCHTRVMPDGTVLPGAQGNNPGDRQGARILRMAAKAKIPVLERLRTFALQFEMPWLDPDPNRRARTMTLDDFIAAGEAIPPGVTARSNTSMLVPPQIPDLIGVRERQYLDHTGLVRHRSIGDLMRYATLVQDVFPLDHYGALPPRATGERARHSDEHLYALATYLYSLEPPANPHRFDDEAALGKRIFERERCGRCHPAPLYTNNRLSPAAGFEPPAEHARRFDVMTERVGTDPRYTLESRKGTGYYKVPSLKGLWYRGPFEHNGSVATLEDWFDPARLRDDYVPTGFNGGGARAVPGHKYGLQLEAAEKKALLAFLKTL